jgi:hypothetical protein
MCYQIFYGHFCRGPLKFGGPPVTGHPDTLPLRHCKYCWHPPNADTQVTPLMNALRRWMWYHFSFPCDATLHVHVYVASRVFEYEVSFSALLPIIDALFIGMQSEFLYALRKCNACNSCSAVRFIVTSSNNSEREFSFAELQQPFKPWNFARYSTRATCMFRTQLL